MDDYFADPTDAQSHPGARRKRGHPGDGHCSGDAGCLFCRIEERKANGSHILPRHSGRHWGPYWNDAGYHPGKCSRECPRYVWGKLAAACIPGFFILMMVLDHYGIVGG